MSEWLDELRAISRAWVNSNHRAAGCCLAGLAAIINLGDACGPLRARMNDRNDKSIFFKLVDVILKCLKFFKPKSFRFFASMMRESGTSLARKTGMREVKSRFILQGKFNVPDC